MEATDRKSYAKPFMWTLIVLGAACCLRSIFHLQLTSLDARFWVLALITVTIGSRVSVQIPRVHGEVTITDTFIFLTMLIFDGESAILLAACESFSSSLRITKSWTTRLFNGGVHAISYFCTVMVLRLSFGSVSALSSNNNSRSFILAISIMALVQYALNSAMIATGCALKAGMPVWQMWRQNFLYTSITYFAGASTAALIAKLIGAMGFWAFVATTPIIAVVYFTYRTYLQNVESKTAQVEQAESYVEELSHHIAEQERISKALQESEAQFRNAFDHAAIGMALVAPDGSWLQVNDSLCNILGYTETELLSMKFQDNTFPEDIEKAVHQMQQLLLNRVLTSQVEKRFMHKCGHTVWVLVNLSLVTASEGHPLHFIAQIQDITERKLAEEQLQHAAFHDGLTNLPNRVMFIDHLQNAIEQARRDQEHLYAVLFVDLDRFKNINDSLGHAHGDQLLMTVARRLQHCLRPTDKAARFGGDEFAVLLSGIKDIADAVHVAERIGNELSQPVDLGGHEVFTTASIGIALSLTGYEQPEDILRDADTAMYRAKANGKARYEVFDKVMHARAMSLLQLENDMRRATEREEFVVLYQPIIELETGRLSGFEALVRWQHPERGLISPAEFIPVAEETGLILSIGRWVLSESCFQLREWQKQFPQAASLSMSVNLSSKQFMQQNLVEQVKQILFESGLDAQCLRLEITESVVMEKAETASKMLRQLKALGVHLSIDDFGTGYSSLSYLHNFPVDTLKVDASFVSRMTERGDNSEIVRTIITLAHNMEMKVVAEGIEQDYQRRQLRALNCEYGQGYLFSKPIGAARAEALIAQSIKWLNKELPFGDATQPVDLELTDLTYLM